MYNAQVNNLKNKFAIRMRRPAKRMERMISHMSFVEAKAMTTQRGDLLDLWFFIK